MANEGYEEITHGVPDSAIENVIQKYEDGAKWVRIQPSKGANGDRTTTLESFVVAGGASQTGTPVLLTPGDKQITFVANGSSGAFTATGKVMYSDDGTNYLEASEAIISGTATTAEGDSIPLNGEHKWIRIDVESFTGTGATLSVIMVG